MWWDDMWQFENNWDNRHVLHFKSNSSSNSSQFWIMFNFKFQYDWLQLWLELRLNLTQNLVRISVKFWSLSDSSSFQTKLSLQLLPILEFNLSLNSSQICIQIVFKFQQIFYQTYSSHFFQTRSKPALLKFIIFCEFVPLLRII